LIRGIVRKESPVVTSARNLIGQIAFVLDGEKYRALVDILDDAPMPNEELRKLMSKEAVWGMSSGPRG